MLASVAGFVSQPVDQVVCDHAAAFAEWLKPILGMVVRPLPWAWFIGFGQHAAQHR